MRSRCVRVVVRRSFNEDVRVARVLSRLQRHLLFHNSLSGENLPPLQLSSSLCRSRPILLLSSVHLATATSMTSTPTSIPSSSMDRTEAQKPSVADLISENLKPFDHQGTIIEPFDNEAKRDTEFQEKLSEMLIELMLEFHAWSTSRPSHESDETADKLEKDINAVLETEKEQGRSSTSPLYTPFVERTRQRLRDFVERIKVALAALADL